MGQLICDFAMCILLLYFHIFTLEVSMKHIYTRYNNNWGWYLYVAIFVPLKTVFKMEKWKK